MRRIALFGLIFLLPVSAQAAMSPSQVFETMRTNGAPRDFAAEAHNHYDGTYFSLWLRGAQEGRGEWLKMRMDVTTHVQRQNDFIKMRMRFLVHRNTLYFTVKDATLTTEDDIALSKLETVLKKWVAVPLGQDMDTSSGFLFIDALAASGLDAVDASNVWHQVMRSVDTALAVEHQKYQGGTAYSIKPAMHDPSLNLHIRANVNGSGNLDFGKFYVGNGTFVFQGSMQPHAGPVNLDIPTATMTLDDFRMYQLGFEFPVPFEPGPDLFAPMRTTTETEEEVPPAYVGMEEPEIPETRNYVEYAKRSGLPGDPLPNCAFPGTMDAVELDRKGICPTPRLYPREIRAIANNTVSGKDLQIFRMDEERVVAGFDRVATKFERYAMDRKMHLAKAMLSHRTLTEVGSDEIDRWLTEDVIPFLFPTIRTWIVEYVLLTDDKGNEGIALQKMLITEAGNRKNYVLIIFREEVGNQPVITDLFLDARLGDLKKNGLLQ